MDLVREPPIEVWFGASRFDNFNEWYITNTFYTTKQGADVLFDFEFLIKDEKPESVLLYYENVKDVSKGVLDVLFQRFNVEDYDDTSSAEGAIVKYLDELKTNDFYFSMDETCPIDHLRETIREKFTRLRQEKIEFWILLYEEYKIKKEEYDAHVREKLKEKSPTIDRMKSETIMGEEQAKIKTQLQDFILEPTHQVSIGVSKSNDDKKKTKSDDCLVAKVGAKTLLEIITLIKEETTESVCLYQNYRDDAARAVTEALMLSFSLKDLDDSGTLEGAIVKHLNDLKMCEFQPSIEQLEQRLNFLRQERVWFWTLLYEEYKARKNDYDMGSLFQLKNKSSHDEMWRQNMINSKLYKVYLREQKE